MKQLWLPLAALAVALVLAACGGSELAPEQPGWALGKADNAGAPQCGCAAEQACVAGQCIAMDAPAVAIRAVSARVTERASDTQQPWDLVGPPTPDPLVEVQVAGQRAISRLVDNRTQVHWNQDIGLGRCLVELPGADCAGRNETMCLFRAGHCTFHIARLQWSPAQLLGGQLTVRVFDADVPDRDRMGECQQPVDVSALAAGQLVIPRCGRTTFWTAAPMLDPRGQQYVDVFDLTLRFVPLAAP